MVNKSKAKGDTSGPSVNETILRECHQLYVEEKTGLFCYKWISKLIVATIKTFYYKLIVLKNEIAFSVYVKNIN